MSSSGILNSLLAAVQASLSVLLTIGWGGLAAHFKLLDSASGKSISKVCVKIFLPALLITKIGSELDPSSVSRYGIILLWAFVCHFVSFLIGIAAHFLFGMPDWITAALMFNNTTSYPLLLIQSLDDTGILTSLITTNESTNDAIDRAKSYFLVFSVVSSCLTFAVGPRLLDSEHAPEAPSKEEEESDDEEEPSEETGLLEPSALHRGSVSFFPSRGSKDRHPSNAVIIDRRPSVIKKPRWQKLSERTRWWLLFFSDFLNAPLLGAVLGAIIGLVPALHRAFFNSTENGGIFTAWLTASLKNVGMLFVPLPLVVAGVSLYTSMQKSNSDNNRSGTPWLTTLFVLLIRFALWPVLSIGVIYLLASKTGWLGNDPMLWFALMLMPTGPPAMKLITMVEVSDASEEDEHKITKLLTISYIISPILAFTVVGSLRASQAALGT